VAPSTGSTGDSFDNALAENLWSTIKVELLYWPGTTFTTRAEAWVPQLSASEGARIGALSWANGCRPGDMSCH
jgi:hypothetical protein